MIRKLDNVKLVKSQKIKKENLIIYNNLDKEVFKVKRVFSIIENKGAIRGKHAHKKCKQFLICNLGKIKIICKDGTDTKTFILSSPSRGLLIPEGIWATQIYLANKNILNVFCDRDFTESDYIRKYKNYLHIYKTK